MCSLNFCLSQKVSHRGLFWVLLFTLYNINNIVSSLNNCCAHLYADDTIVYCFSDSATQAIENLQLCFNALQEALTDLKFVLNANKTKFMLFTRNKNVSYEGLHIHTVNGVDIERVSGYKYLSIWLDEAHI